MRTVPPLCGMEEERAAVHESAELEQDLADRERVCGWRGEIVGGANRAGTAGSGERNLDHRLRRLLRFLDFGLEKVLETQAIAPVHDPFRQIHL